MILSVGMIENLKLIMLSYKEFLEDLEKEEKTVVWQTDKKKYGSAGAAKKKRERKKSYRKNKHKIKRQQKKYRAKVKRRGGKNLGDVKVKKRGQK